MNTFRQKIREKIADNNLQTALDGNDERRLKGRKAAIATLPDWEERRQKAHAIRADVVEHLDEYVERFLAKVAENGIIVHRAADAAEAVGIILKLVGDAPAVRADGHPPQQKLIAKAKSMVSEEIELNHALEAAGHRVVETDLGEYIIQLRHERPSHIITPAVHLRRQQVGELFAEKLGVPYTDDIPTLTATARKVLREVFLTADIGMSGVNFGVVESGTLTIVTNEGNGRMCTTLPPIHIALMGMERMVPTLDDLALMLSLLPRSATGQKLSVYTQFIQSPLKGQTRHLVIVDNGRRRLQASRLREALYCIRCGACLNACPIFREIGGHAYLGVDGSIAPYPGPIGSVVSPGLLGMEQFGQLAQASSLCGACKEACPVDIDLPKLLLRVRAGGKNEDRNSKEGIGIPAPVKMGLGGYARAATTPGLFAAGQRMLGLVSSPLPPFINTPAWTGWGYSKDFPKPARKSFRDRWNDMEKKQEKIIQKTEIQEKSEATARMGEVASSGAALLAPTLENRFDRFISEISALGGQAHVYKQDQITEILISFLHERKIDALQAWDEVPGVDQARLAEAGIRVERDYTPALAVGITGVQAASCETGSILVCEGAGDPLTASLVPDIHLAVVRAQQISESLPQIIGKVTETPAAALITGPSRTADIEMTLTIGVHGPKELHVFIVDDSGSG